MQKINPCLWFNDQAEEATKFYTSLFKNSEVGKIARYSDTGGKVSGQKKDTVMTVEFELEGQTILALNGGPTFKFTPALSLFVWRKTEKDIDELWEKLSAGGEVRMGLDKYPWAPKYGWTTDKYGVDWQLMLSDNEPKIAPAFLFVEKLFGKGEEAINFYMSLFNNSKIKFIARDESTKTILHCVFSLDGQDFVLMEGPGTHSFTFSHAFSLIVNCDTQEEIDDYWQNLSAGGSTEQCGWLKDKYGVSWQIVPSVLGELMNDPIKSDHVMKALVQMTKPDIAKIVEAYE